MSDSKARNVRDARQPAMPATLHSHYVAAIPPAGLPRTYRGERSSHRRHSIALARTPHADVSASAPGLTQSVAALTEVTP